MFRPKKHYFMFHGLKKLKRNGLVDINRHFVNDSYFYLFRIIRFWFVVIGLFFFLIFQQTLIEVLS